jgi:hypothetical protein
LDVKNQSDAVSIIAATPVAAMKKVSTQRTADFLVLRKSTPDYIFRPALCGMLVLAAASPCIVLLPH